MKPMKIPFVLFPLILPLLLTACIEEKVQPSPEPEQQPTKALKQPTKNKTTTLQNLLQQKRIDPITRYLNKHCQQDSSNKTCQKLTTARQQRCAQVKKSFHEKDKTQAQLDKLRVGYTFSCPQIVKHFANTIKTTQAAQLTAKISADPNIKKCDEAYNQRDYAKALKSCHLLAKTGNPKAQLKLGIMHADGRGVTKNYQEAYVWFSLAVQGGLQAASVLRDAIAKSLTTQQLLEANERALTITSQYH
jgi:TPR repeat protein